MRMKNVMPNILIAEDDLASRELLREYFSAIGWEVEAAADGAEAVRLAQTNRPDLFLFDIRMPVMDGYQALSALRSDSSTSHVPAIALSAFATSQDRSRGINAGFAAYLTKPIDLSQLLATASSLVSARKGSDWSSGPAGPSFDSNIR
jgi:CheY-like chemotaxis protein